MSSGSATTYGNGRRGIIIQVMKNNEYLGTAPSKDEDPPVARVDEARSMPVPE
jgi:hypothetical protein